MIGKVQPAVACVPHPDFLDRRQVGVPTGELATHVFQHGDAVDEDAEIEREPPSRLAEFGQRTDALVDARRLFGIG